MYTCDACKVNACWSSDYDKEKLPKNCPMRDEEYFAQILDEYMKPEINKFYVNCSAIEALGYCQWPRLREVAEFAKRMGYQKLGIGFCGGLADEAAVVATLLRKQGFEVYSVKCKAGAVPKQAAGATVESLGVEEPTEKQISLCASPMCNPIAQAILLNRAGTEFNICLGLCVGHDSLFYKYSEAPVTTLVAKDRVTGNNPVAAIYCANTYFSKRNTIED